jgi:putative ABC transport system permease protein
LDWANQSGGRVIGVVRDFHFKSLHQKIEPLVIHLSYSADAFINFVVRLRPLDMPATLAFLEQKWREVYPQHPFEYSFLDEDFDHLYRAEKLRGKIFGAFAGLAIFIACLGLSGLAAFSAEQRTKEIGIRKVLGAAESHIVFLLSREFILLVLLANLVAWPIAYWTMRNWLQDFAYRTPLQWELFLAGGALALIISLLTVSFQAIKAALANPVEALRYE